jgi:hypothetical protein
LVIENVQNNAVMPLVAEMLMHCDRELDEETIRAKAWLYPPCYAMTPGKSLAEAIAEAKPADNTRRVKISDFDPSAQFLAALGDPASLPEAMRHWILRHDLDQLDTQAMEAARSPALHLILSLAEGMGLTRTQVEQLLERQLASAVEGTPAEGSIIAVRLDSYRMEGPRDSKRTPVSVGMADARLRVYLASASAVTRMQAVSSKLMISLGAGPEAITAITSLTPCVSWKESDSLYTNRKRTAMEKAWRQVDDDMASPMTLTAVEARMDIDFTVRRVRNTLQVEQAIRQALGGELRSIHSVVVAMEANTSRPRPDQGVCVLVLEFGDTRWAQQAADLLKPPAGKASESPFASDSEISRFKPAKDSIRITPLRRDAGPSQDDLPSDGMLRRQIADFLYSKGPLCLPARQVDGRQIVQRGNTSQLTPLENLGPRDVASMDGRQYTDIRTLMPDNIPAGTLYGILEEMEARQDMFTYHEMVDVSTHREFVAMFHPNKDPFRGDSGASAAGEAHGGAA